MDQKNWLIRKFTFIDNDNEYVTSEIANQLKNLCLKRNRPQLLGLLLKLCNLNDRLDEIWENDPDHLRYISKFPSLNKLAHQQEYYRDDKFRIIQNSIFCKSEVWQYQISARLGYGYMTSIIEQCKKSKISFLPIDLLNWTHNRAVVFNFLASFRAVVSGNCYVWILILAENKSQKDIHEIERDILGFLTKFELSSFSRFGHVPITVIERSKNRDIDLTDLINDLDRVSNK